MGTAFRTPLLVLALVILASAFALHAAASPAPAPEREALERARAVAAELDARYRALEVTEVTSMSVVESVTLVTSLPELRVVPAANGVYFALCAARAVCPYPPRRAAWPLGAPRPRRLALELAVRTLQETTLDLVVVALPTARPVWFVLERSELDAVQREQDATSSRLYLPVALEPVSATRSTLVAVQVGGDP